MNVSVVVPVYGGADTIGRLLEEIREVLPGVAASWEVIFVNDGSPDKSWEVIAGLCAANPEVRGICLRRNYGQHNALLCGIRAARMPVIVTMDDDLQHRAAEIPRLLAKLEEGYDLVYGTPRELPHSPLRNLLSRVTKIALARCTGIPGARYMDAFRVFRTHIRDAFAHYSSPNLHLDAIMTWGTTRVAWIFVQHRPRAVGKSNYTPLRLFNQLMVLLTGYSVAPLRMGSLLGFATTLFGACMLAYVVGSALILGNALPGFSFLASAICIFSGIQLFTLGIIGEYIARMYLRSTERPAYVMREEIGQGPPAP